MRAAMRGANGVDVRAAAIVAVSMCLGAWHPTNAAAEPSDKALARRILDATGVKGGVVVHVGCGDGRLTASLRANDSYLVHGLDTDRTNVEKARAHIRSLGLYGKVSVACWHGKRLPYIDNLVNLVVCERQGRVPVGEVTRVLCPGGVAYVRQGATWTKQVKPRPDQIDEWTHYLHDATNNCVAHDTVVGPPRRFQWVGSPRWSRHHDRMASMSALVSSGGRIFYIFDEGSTASVQLPPNRALIARDAFNGTVLWKRRIPSWHTHLWPFKSGPAWLPRRLVAVGDRVFAPLGRHAPLTALDAATGATVLTYKQTKATEEVILSQGVLFVLVNATPKPIGYRPAHRDIGMAKARVARRWPWDAKDRQIVAIQADTGKLLWTKRTAAVPLTLAADHQRVLFHNGDKIVCLDRTNGEQRWASEPVKTRRAIPTSFGPTLVAYQDVVLFAGGNRSMCALAAETGKTLWTARHHRGGHNSPEDLMVVGGLVWSGAVASGRDTGVFTGRDLHTGEVTSEFTPDVKRYWFHHRCYRSKATDRYLLPSRTGIEFVDVRNKQWITHHWVRGGCIYGIMPCNGLVYAPPHSCACYLIAKLYGFCALAPASKTAPAPRPVSDAGRLDRGPAYAQPVSARPTKDAWPTYRHDAQRSGRTKASVPTQLERAWATKLGGRLSSVVVADGKLFVASVDTHTVHALDARTGRAAWSYTAGARVDSPPTIHRGRALFGSADGYVYCVRASDGELIWRFRAAPQDRRMGAFEQVESVWPTSGSVLVKNDVVYGVAGRSMFLDGGLRLVRLDAKTGRKLSETIMDNRDPATGKNLQVHVKGLNMPCALPDILSADDKHVYMRSQRFHLAGQRAEVRTPTNAADQGGEGKHLFAPAGFLDGSWFHRAYWLYGKTPLSGCGGYYQAGRFAPAGRILTFDDTSVYGYGRKPQYFQWTTPLDYHLWAASAEIPRVDKVARRGGRSTIYVARTKSQNPTNKPLTVEAWVKAEQPSGVVVARGGSAQGYALVLRRGRPQFVIRVNKDASAVTAKQKVGREWAHLVGVLTADKKLEIYVNGKLSRRADALGFIVARPAQAMQIGADEGSAVGTYRAPFDFTGIIDEVRVYHRALSADEIRAHYEAPKPVRAKDPALVLHFSFDKGDATDDSGNKNHGIVETAKPTRGKFGGGMRFTRRVKRRAPFLVKHHWSQDIPLHVRAMVLADRTLFIAGPPDVIDDEKVFDRYGDAATRAKLAEQAAALEGRKGGLLWAVSTADGSKLAEYKLESPPAWDAMAAADGRLYLATTDGHVVCMGRTR